MTRWVPWLAQLNPLGDDGLATLANSTATTLLANNAALVVLAGLCLTLLFARWAARLWRKAGRRRRKFKGLSNLAIPRADRLHSALAIPNGPGASLKRVTAPPPQAPAPAPARRPASASRASRRRVRAHRPRNPTLAEIGGLPPLRPASDSPPAAP